MRARAYSDPLLMGRCPCSLSIWVNRASFRKGGESAESVGLDEEQQGAFRFTFPVWLHFRKRRMDGTYPCSPLAWGRKSALWHKASTEPCTEMQKRAMPTPCTLSGRPLFSPRGLTWPIGWTTPPKGISNVGGAQRRPDDRTGKVRGGKRCPSAQLWRNASWRP